MKKPERHIDEAALEAIRRMPCAACHPSWYRTVIQNRINPAGLHISDPSHIKSRGAGGGDEVWNLLPLCREHHTMWHKIGVTAFLKSFPHIWAAMHAMGWRFHGNGIHHAEE